MEIRFTIIPSAAVSSAAGKLATKYASRFPHRFVVDNKNLFPHVTLFKVTVGEKNYREVLLATKAFAKKFKSFSVPVKGFEITSGGWLAMDVKLSPQLLKLRMGLAKELKEQNLVESLRIKPNFSPHITLTRFYNDKNCQLAIESEKKPDFKLTVATIGLCLSRATQVYKIIDRCKLND